MTKDELKKIWVEYAERARRAEANAINGIWVEAEDRYRDIGGSEALECAEHARWLQGHRETLNEVSSGISR